MRRIHTFVIAGVLAIAAVTGLFAVSRTTQLGAAARTQVSPGQIAARNRQLDRIEKSLLAQAQGSRHGVGQAQAPTIYVRPKPIVRILHHAGGEHENEAEGNGGVDD